MGVNIHAGRGGGCQHQSIGQAVAERQPGRPGETGILLRRSHVLVTRDVVSDELRHRETKGTLLAVKRETTFFMIAA